MAYLGEILAKSIFYEVGISPVSPDGFELKEGIGALELSSLTHDRKGKRVMQNLLRSTRAGTLVEYGLLAGLVSAIAISSIWSLGRQVDFTHLVAALEVSDIHTPLGNFLENGDFDDVSGMTPTGYGYFSHTLTGWTSNNGLPFELHESGHMGMQSVNGDYWLDTAASPGQMDIEQAVSGLKNGLVYRLTLWAGDRQPDLSSQAMIFWNGKHVATIRPSVEDEMQAFRFYVQSGAGDGTDRIRIVEIGGDDSYGLSLDQVRIWGPGDFE